MSFPLQIYSGRVCGAKRLDMSFPITLADSLAFLFFPADTSVEEQLAPRQYYEHDTGH